MPVLTYYHIFNETYFDKTDILFINGNIPVSSINKLINKYHNIKIVCIIGERNDKIISNGYRVWLGNDNNTTYDNGFINTYDVICRGFGKQFRELEYNFNCTYDDKLNIITNPVIF